MKKRYTDLLIIGAGTSGCCLANRLSQNESRKVLLVESGGWDRWHWIHIPVGYLFCMGNKKTDWCYKTKTQNGLNGRQLPYPRGRILGGSSSINGMIYMRGQREDYDNWNLPGWSWKDVLPRFKLSEKHHGGETEFHGSNGEVYVQKQRLRWEILDACHDACVAWGIPQISDFNTGNNEGVGYFEVNQKNGIRWSASSAFLHPILNRPNFSL